MYTCICTLHVHTHTHTYIYKQICVKSFWIQLSPKQASLLDTLICACDNLIYAKKTFVVQRKREMLGYMSRH